MKSRLMMFLAAALFCAVTAHATPILYTVTDTGSGRLGTSTFRDQAITVSFLGDTKGVSGSAGLLANTVGTGTVTVAGVGTATFTDAVEFFVNQGSMTAGIADIDTGSILDTVNAAFRTYGGTTSIGPVSGDVFFRPDLSFTTTSGLLRINSTGAVSTFRASTTTPAPEPSTMVLFGTGALGLVGVARQRLARA